MLLGSILLRPDRYYEAEVTADDFLSLRCRKVYEAVGGILSAGESVDFGSVMLAYPEVDIAWLASLTDEATPNVSRLVDAVLEASRRHRLEVLAKEVLERAKEEPAGTVLEHLEAGLTAITDGRTSDVVALSTEVKPMVDEFERRYQAKGALPGITSGLDDLDEITMGFEPSRVYVVGARPSEGKSALLLNFALAAAEQVPVGFISIESSRHELLERAFANLSGIDGYALRRGTFRPAAMHDMTEAATQLTSLPLYVADRPNMQLAELKSRARRMVRNYGARLILIDYLQLVQLPGQMSDYERVSQVSVAVKALSRELEVPIIAAAQLNRGAEEGKNRRPRLSDFKNSGQIEQDADTAILIYIDRKGTDDEQVYLMVEKNRDGATAGVRVYFDKKRMRFRNVIQEVA